MSRPSSPPSPRCSSPRSSRRPPAAAHARLEASSPKDGSTLTATPPEVMLRFNEPVKDGLNQVSVKSGSTDVTDGDLELAGNTVYQPLKTVIDAGDYTITYKVVSADGHPISGSVKFTYAPPEGDQGAGEPTTSATSGTSSDAPSSSSSTSGTTPPPASSTSEPTTPLLHAGAEHEQLHLARGERLDQPDGRRDRSVAARRLRDDRRRRRRGGDHRRRLRHAVVGLGGRPRRPARHPGRHRPAPARPPGPRRRRGDRPRRVARLTHGTTTKGPTAMRWGPS
ncbi:copper resistance protein CopC [Janibacter hoylei PVAS-1]|uniref:Copper resistance protein CopC n=1 Tax=Janibacter hoylei PVAS-1 TaxID=1210046 RepID=K1DYP7_9MICO|nr:copper resistance CopC family protein [Janibacter hoylei]EKA59901.1 copper resistance protein CopC [Janibacter hoylei PVAS-1]